MAKKPLRPDLDITELWCAAQKGDQDAVNELMEELYDDLKECAHHLAHGEPPSVSTRAVVSEVYLRLVHNIPAAQNREHIRLIIYRVMRNILCDWGRKRRNPIRAGYSVESLDQNPLRFEVAESTPPPDHFLETVLAMERLEETDRALADILQMHDLCGMTLEEIAEIRSISKSTVANRLKEARKMIRQQARHKNS